MEWDGTTPRDLSQADIAALKTVWMPPKIQPKKPSDFVKYMEMMDEQEEEKSKLPKKKEEVPVDGNPGCLHFHGNLSLELPEDNEEVKSSGYVCLTSPVC